jgi:hypothetical protein
MLQSGGVFISNVAKITEVVLWIKENVEKMKEKNTHHNDFNPSFGCVVISAQGPQLAESLHEDLIWICSKCLGLKWRLCSPRPLMV